MALPRDARTRKVVKKRPSEVKDTKAAAEFKPATKALKRRAELRTQVKDEKGEDLRRGQRAAKPVIKQQRIKYLRRTRDRGISLKKELEGRGLISKGLSVLSDNAAKNTASGRVSATLGIDEGKAGRLVKDVVNFPAQAVPSVYVPVAAAYEAAKGDSKRLKQLGKDIDEGDPIYNLGAAAVAKVKGDGKEASKRYKRSMKAFDEHPGFTLIEAAGVKGMVGRGAGRTMRSGVVGKKAKRVASTQRAPKVLEGTKLTQPRVYSKDVIKKAEQVARERRQRTSAQTLRQKADIEMGKGNKAEAERLRHRAAKKDPDRLDESEIRKRVDERQAANEDIRRIHRAEVTHEARKILKVAKREEKAVPLVAQRITKADPEDLKAYRDELAAQFDGLTPAQKRANKQTREAIDDVLKDPKADMSRVEQAANAYRDLIEPLQNKLTDRKLLAEDQVDRAKLIPYATRKMGATHDKKLGLLDSDGAPLSSQRIRAHMRKHGVEEPAFITQAPNQRGARNYFQSSNEPKKASAGVRTGEATRKGTFDADPETLVEGAAKAQGLADATDGFRGFLDEFGHRIGGKVVTRGSYKEAKRVADNLMFDKNGDPKPGAVKMRPVKINPWGASKEQLQDLLERIDVDAQGSHKAVVKAIEDALESPEGDGPWALIPEAAADQLAQHMRTLGSDASAKSLQAVNQAFRRAVLATSPTWMTGNVAEGAFRSAMAKAGPRSYVTGRRTLKESKRLDPEKGLEAEVRTVGGGQMKSAQQVIKRSADQFDDTKLEGMARGLSAFWRAPGPKQAAGVWNWWTDLVFNKVNGSIEQTFQTAMLGKAIRDSHLMDGQLRKTGKTAVQQAAEGLLNTNEQVAFGRQVDLMYGKYRKFSPAMRRTLVLYTPFAAWAVNAAYFVARTLPREHPTTTAVIAAAEQASEEWRKEHGLDLFVKGRRPGFLQGAIPLAGGESQRAPNRYLPFSFFADPLNNAASAVLPQYSGVLAAFEGEDWKGKKLTVDGEPANEVQKAAFAARAFAEATVPFLSRGQQVAGKGPGSLNPFKPVAPAKKKLRKSASSGPKWTDGGGGVKWTDGGSGVTWSDGG